MPNPTLAKFKKNNKYSKNIKNILIVSNHIPNEVMEAKSLLEAEDFKLHILGESGKSELISPELLSNYDAIISIGKTVQMSILSGIPIYCYDHFGGPGWLRPHNIAQASRFNFSGRGFDEKKTSHTIYSEIKSYNSNIDIACENTFRNTGKYIIGVWIYILSKYLEKSHSKKKIQCPNLNSAL
ncbi:hypothetical protein NKW45_11925 [Acetobacter orientalis]|uniref:hypothetical protein n=1 Tax=Acetobacter orientalis TaxID=146474 RepID=UPI0020A5A8C6|nr:hypothetical protein [Acetobacter orientalis]MCP1222552.1 hypothetical protein [Acetobacter orientalis]